MSSNHFVEKIEWLPTSGGGIPNGRPLLFRTMDGAIHEGAYSQRLPAVESVWRSYISNMEISAWRVTHWAEKPVGPEVENPALKPFVKKERERRSVLFCGRYVEASAEVLAFIENFRESMIEPNNVIRNAFQFYSFYFAHMLKLAFGRGDVCAAAPTGHVVWVDDDGIRYDIDGISDSEFECLIPVEALGKGVEVFMRVPGKDGFCDAEQITKLMETWASFSREKENEARKYGMP